MQAEINPKPSLFWLQFVCQVKTGVTLYFYTGCDYTINCFRTHKKRPGRTIPEQERQVSERHV